MENKVRVDRLKQLHHMLINHDKLFTKPERKVGFNIDTWSCGTAACALGSAALYTPFIEQGLEMGTYGGGENKICYPVFEGKKEWDAGAKFFGITDDESQYLFSPSEYERWACGDRDECVVDDSSEVTAKSVAKRVKKLINKYEEQEK